MSGGGTRSGRRKTGGGASANPSEEPVRGIPQSEIDKLRGTREHFDADKFNYITMLDDYKRVGIKLSTNEIADIKNAISGFTGGEFRSMREAAQDFYAGEKLDSEKQKLFNDYQKIIEYTKIAPTYKGAGQYIYRGINALVGPKYAASLRALKPGDTIDFRKIVASFSSSEKIAQNFAIAGGAGGIVFRAPTSKIKNAPSIKGLSHWSHEEEILVSDNFKISKITTANGLTYIDVE